MSLGEVRAWGANQGFWGLWEELWLGGADLRFWA